MSVPLSIDDFGLAITELRSVLRQPVAERDPRWAHDVCTYTRFIHINVWASSPRKTVVQSKVIPLLVKAMAELLNVNGQFRSAQEKADIMAYRRNIQVRINNLRRYTRGCQSLRAAELKQELARAERVMKQEHSIKS